APATRRISISPRRSTACCGTSWRACRRPSATIGACRRERARNNLAVLAQGIATSTSSSCSAPARAEMRERGLGYLAAPGLDADALLLDVVHTLGTDRVDLVDLARAGAQVRFQAARDGRVLYEGRSGAFGTSSRTPASLRDHL